MTRRDALLILRPSMSDKTDEEIIADLVSSSSHTVSKNVKPGGLLIGTLFARLLESVGIRKGAGCACQKRQDWLDKNGAAVCFSALMLIALLIVLFLVFARR
jgi:hypothetical protein